MSDANRRLSRPDAILVGIVGASMIAAAIVLEWEFQATDRWSKAQRPTISNNTHASPWPAWTRDAVIVARRRAQTIKAALVVASLGLALVAFRPRGRKCRRAGPGLVALALGAGFSLLAIAVFARYEWFDPMFVPKFAERRIPGSSLMPLSRITRDCEIGLARLIIPAWIYLALTGHWRRPLDPLEKLGRWLGWCWIGIALVGWIVDRVPFW